MDAFTTQRTLALNAGDSGYESDLARDLPISSHLEITKHQGSEDQIIPCSDEDEETEESEESVGLKEKLNLSRFSFVSK